MLKSGEIDHFDIYQAFVDREGSEVRADRAFLTYLATANMQDPERSLLGSVVPELKSAEGKEIAIRSFIQERISVPGSILQSMKAMFERGNTGTATFEDFFSRDFENWPDDIKSSFEKYRGALTGQVKRNIARMTEKYAAKRWVVPSLEQIEHMVDIAYRSMHKEYSNKHHRNRSKARERSKSKRSINAPDPRNILEKGNGDANQRQASERRRDKVMLGKIGTVENGAIVAKDVESVQQMIEKFVDRNDRALVASLVKVIEEYICVDPFVGIATKLVKAAPSTNINGENVKVYRTSPRDIPGGFKISRRARDARIIWARGRGTVFILDVSTSHAKTDRRMAQLDKRSK